MCVDAVLPEFVSFVRNCVVANDVVGLYTGLCDRSYLDILLCYLPLRPRNTLTNQVLSKAVDLLQDAFGNAVAFDRFHCREQRAIRAFVCAAMAFSRTSRNRVSVAVQERVLETVNIVDSIPGCACPDCWPPLQKGTNTPLRRSMRIRNAPL
jgi:hypothetical protein